MSTLERLPPELPRPVDDGACDHLPGMAMPAVSLPSSDGGTVDLGALPAGRVVLYGYPMTGRPGETLPEDWDAIPGARGCTPQACAFRDHAGELRALGVAALYALSTQGTDYQREMAERLHLPFPVLSDADFRLTRSLRLPTFEAGGLRLIRRLTLIIQGGIIEHVIYPVFPPDENADQVMRWLREQVRA